MRRTFEPTNRDATSTALRQTSGDAAPVERSDRKTAAGGKSVDLGGRRPVIDFTAKPGATTGGCVPATRLAVAPVAYVWPPMVTVEPAISTPFWSTTFTGVPPTAANAGVHHAITRASAATRGMGSSRIRRAAKMADR